MNTKPVSRRRFLSQAALGAMAAGTALSGSPGVPAHPDDTQVSPAQPEKASQRLSLSELQKWESWQYGMFIHFGMSTFVGQELPDLPRWMPSVFAATGPTIDGNLVEWAGLPQTVLNQPPVPGLTIRESEGA